jgi:hypothetical protein
VSCCAAARRAEALQRFGDSARHVRCYPPAHEPVFRHRCRTGPRARRLRQCGQERRRRRQHHLEQLAVDERGDDEHGIDRLGVDRLGVDQLGVDQLGADHGLFQLRLGSALPGELPCGTDPPELQRLGARLPGPERLRLHPQPMSRSRTRRRPVRVPGGVHCPPPRGLLRLVGHRALLQRVRMSIARRARARARARVRARSGIRVRVRVRARSPDPGSGSGSGSGWGSC